MEDRGDQSSDGEDYEYSDDESGEERPQVVRTEEVRSLPWSSPPISFAFLLMSF